MNSKASTVILLFLTLAQIQLNLSTAQALAPIPERMCPINMFQLSVCANILGSLLDPASGSAAAKPCCSRLGGLGDLDAAVCICNAIKLDILGINLNIPLVLGLVLNSCSRTLPIGLHCA